MLLSTSYWHPVPACGFCNHGVYSFEPATAVAHDPAETGLRQVTAQPSGLTHVDHRQSLGSNKHGRLRALFTHWRNHTIAVELAEVRQISYLSFPCPYSFCAISISSGESEVLVILVYQFPFQRTFFA
jgi:hypothetical protein